MKAIQIKQTGGPEVMELVDLPVPPPKPNEAVVRILAAGVNFIDVYNREGRYKAPLPLVLKQEGAGVVSAVGSEVREVAVGDRVAYTNVLGSYKESSGCGSNTFIRCNRRYRPPRSGRSQDYRKVAANTRLRPFSK